MHTTWQRGLAIGALLLAALISGCNKSNDKVIAEVGNYNITVKEFEDLTKGMPENFRTAQEEFDTKSQMLDSMVIQRLLIQAAYDKGLDKSEEVAQAVLANKDKFLLDALYKRHVENKVAVTEAELKDYYNKLENKYRIAHILVADKDTANMIVKKLSEGASFEQLAYDYSIDPNAKRNRGDLGFMLYGSMAAVPEFQETAFNLQPGEVSQPVKTRYGYHIIKVVDKQPNDMRTDFDKMKESLENQLKNIKLTKLTVDYVEEIRAKYPITVDTSTANYLVHKRQELYPPDLLKTLPKNDFDESQLDRNERELVLATWEGGQVNVMDYLTLSRRLPAAARPDFASFDSLKQAVFQAKISDILVYEANKEGLESDDDYQRKMTLFKELTMADVMRNDSIMKAQTPKDDDVRAYYDAHQTEFADPARVHIYEILVSDELVANKLASQIKSLDEFKKKAMELTERPGLQKTDGDLSYVIREQSPEIFDVAIKTPVGAIGGPVVTGGKYSIFYVVDKIEAQPKDFLTVKQQIAAKMVSDQEGERFKQWINERKEKTKIQVNTEALWSTVNKQKYAATDTTAAPSGN